MSTWASRRPRSWQRDSLVGHRLWGGLWASLSLYLGHNRLWGNWRLWFSHWGSFVAHWSSLVCTVPARSSSHLWLRLRLVLGLRLRLRLLCNSSFRYRPTFHCTRVVLVGRWLDRVCLPVPNRLPVGCGQVGEAFGLLVATLGSSFDGG